jgi:predicted aspartyl protease
MKKFFVSMLLVATMAPFRAQSQQTGGTLASFLARQGLAGAKLERRWGNHLFIPVSINNRRAALLIDTGSPHTIIDVNSVNSFGLTVEKTCDGVAHDV